MAVGWCLLLCTSVYAADKWKSVEGLMLDGVPDNWQQTRLADEIEVNGLPMLIYEIEGRSRCAKRR
ncbi:hypothetical protein CFter6_2780 [Collimonas fungivorans]|uniref:Uncharacterized protein n=2 Tax=Collimonas fungivorans TaxID=158899 RepID=A0A127PCC9_9BURK|nr:hypothetical protein CFter6_2780 [Collimonas fungivorans]